MHQFVIDSGVDTFFMIGVISVASFIADIAFAGVFIMPACKVVILDMSLFSFSEVLSSCNSLYASYTDIDKSRIYAPACFLT